MIAEAAAEETQSWAKLFRDAHELFQRMPEQKLLWKGPNGLELVTATAQWKQDHEHDRGLVPLQFRRDGKIVDVDVFDSIYVRFYSKHDGAGEVLAADVNIDAAFAGRSLTTTLTRQRPSTATSVVSFVITALVGWLRSRFPQHVQASASSLSGLAKEIVGEVVAGVKIESAYVVNDVVAASGMKDDVHARLFMKHVNSELVVDLCVGAQKHRHVVAVNKAGSKHVRKWLRSLKATAAAEPELLGTLADTLRLVKRVHIFSKHFRIQTFPDTIRDDDPFLTVAVGPHSSAGKIALTKKSGLFTIKVNTLNAKSLTVKAGRSIFNEGLDVQLTPEGATASAKALYTLRWIKKKLEQLDANMADFVFAAHILDNHLHVQSKHHIAAEYLEGFIANDGSYRIRGRFEHTGPGTHVETSPWGGGSYSDFSVTLIKHKSSVLVRVETGTRKSAQRFEAADDPADVRAWVQSMLLKEAVELDARL